MGVIVRQKNNGKGQPWWIFINHQGRRMSRKVGDKKAAEAVASEIRKKLRLGEFAIDTETRTIPTFKLYAKGFMETYSKINHKPSTRDSYKAVLNLHIKPVFGDKRLDEITRKDIKSFIVEKQASGLSANTVRLILSYLSAILNEAVDDEIIDGNPALRVRKAIAKDHKEEISPLTAGELNHLLETAEKHFSDHYTMFLLMARTGMRIGEVTGLEWGDIDFNGRFIEVRRSIVRGRVSTPKSGKSRRVDMSPQLAGALEVHKTASKRKGLALGTGEPSSVFTNRIGGKIDLNNWRRRVYNKVLTTARLRKIRIPDLRHTYATLRIAAGHNISDVSNQLGHHSVKLTLDVYNHWLPGQNKSEVDSLDNLHLTPHQSAPQAHPEALPNKKAAPESRVSP
jgi:integrase